MRRLVLCFMLLLLSNEAAAQTPQRIAEDEFIFAGGVDDASDNFELYAMGGDGAHVRQLTDDATYESTWARLSPDRRQIAFHRAPLDRTNELNRYPVTSTWLMNADGSNLREIRAAQTDGWLLHGHVEWSPDGQSLLIFGRKKLAGPTQLYLIDLEGNVIRQIYQSKGDMADPAFSPDGTEIVFAGCPEGSCPSADIYTIKTDGSQPPIKLTDNDIQENDPTFSPDGQTIAWNRNTLTRLLPPTGESLVLLADYDGKRLTNIRQAGDNQINAVPVWSLDGSRIFVHRFDYTTSKWDLFSAEPDGSNPINYSVALRPTDKPRYAFWFPHAGTHSGGTAPATVKSAQPVVDVRAEASPVQPDDQLLVPSIAQTLTQSTTQTLAKQTDSGVEAAEATQEKVTPQPANFIPIVCFTWVVGVGIGYLLGRKRYKPKSTTARIIRTRK